LPTKNYANLHKFDGLPDMFDDDDERERLCAALVSACDDVFLQDGSRPWSQGRYCTTCAAVALRRAMAAVPPFDLDDNKTYAAVFESLSRYIAQDRRFKALAAKVWSDPLQQTVVRQLTL